MSGGAVILAAGNSTRFGSDKRRFPLSGKGAMLEATLALYQAVFEQCFVVLKPQDSFWAGRLRGVCSVHAQDAALGMGHSLAAGVAAARHLDYLFVALADMPYVQTATLAQLRRELTDANCIVQPECQGRPGHPVGFGSAYFGELQALSGDIGAKPVLDRHAALIRRVPVADTGTIRDIDVPPSR